MADKKITQLQQISSVTDDLNLPSDNGLQSYRVTTAQLFNYITSKFFGSTSKSAPIGADALSIYDSAASNAVKKILLSALRNAVYRSVTTTDSVGVDDETMVLSGASFTSTLPTAVGVAGKRYKLIHSGTSYSQIYTLATTSAQTIGGVASGSYKLVSNGEVLEIESNGANWLIVSHYVPSKWESVTPTVGSFGTIANVNVFGRRVGDSYQMRGYFQSGTTIGSAASISTPSAIDSAKFGSGTSKVKVGEAIRILSGSNAFENTHRVFYDGSDTAKVYLGLQTGSDVFVKMNANAIIDNGQYLYLDFMVPMADWQG